VDLDTIWLDNPHGWWSQFEKVDAQGALLGMAQENKGAAGWYKLYEDCPGDKPFSSHVHLLCDVKHDSLHLMHVSTPEFHEGCEVAQDVRGLPQ